VHVASSGQYGTQGPDMTTLSPSMAGGRAAPPRWPRHLRALAAGLLLAAAWGSVVQTQFNLQALVLLGVPVPPGLRAMTTLQDLAGFAPVYAGIIAAGWLPALGLAAWLARRRPAWRMLAIIRGIAATGQRFGRRSPPGYGWRSPHSGASCRCRQSRRCPPW